VSAGALQCLRVALLPAWDGRHRKIKVNTCLPAAANIYSCVLCAPAICFALWEVGHYIQTQSNLLPVCSFFFCYYALFALSAYAGVLLILFAMHKRVFIFAERDWTVYTQVCSDWYFPLWVCSIVKPMLFCSSLIQFWWQPDCGPEISAWVPSICKSTEKWLFCMGILYKML
jgi:hypothetical protein